MALFTNDLYEHDVFTVKKLGDYIYRISFNSSVRKSGFEPIEGQTVVPSKRNVNSDKLLNNLSRAKSTIKELALSNPWDYFVTLTYDRAKTERYDLNSTVKKFNEFVHNYNRRCSKEEKVSYLIIPENHKDGAWHAHGVFKGIRKRDLYVNKYGYLSWKQYEDKFGFISLDKDIHDIKRLSSYILKYISKDFCRTDIKINAHSYYHSKGLKKAEILYRGHGNFTGTWGWEHEDGYCKILEFDIRELDIHDVFEII